MIELTFLKVLMLIKQMREKSVIFATLGFFFKGFLLNLSDIAILNIHGVDFRSIINGISKIKAVNLKTKKLIQTKKLERYKT